MSKLRHRPQSHTNGHQTGCRGPIGLALCAFLLSTPASHALPAVRACKDYFQYRISPPQVRQRPNPYALTANLPSTALVQARGYVDLYAQVGKPVHYTSPGTEENSMFRVGPFVIHDAAEFNLTEQAVIEQAFRSLSDDSILAEARRRAFDRAQRRQEIRDISLSIFGRRDRDRAGEQGREHVGQTLQRPLRSLEVEVEAELRHGVETVVVVLELMDGRFIPSPMATSYMADGVEVMQPTFRALRDFGTSNRDDYGQIKSIRIFHPHPNNSIWTPALSPADIEGVRGLLQHFATAEWYPEIHIFAVSGDPRRRLVGHYGAQLANPSQ